MRKAATMSAEHLSIAWQSASLMLGYPDEALLAQLETVHRATHALPDDVGGPLRSTVLHLERTPLTQLQEEYVETFDTRRRHNLFLTYFAHGDTRKRGVALLRFKQTYLRSGFVLDDSELPDHLCVVLEYAAAVDQELGRRLLLDHRAGLELLRTSLQDVESGWAGAVAAVAVRHPGLRPRARRAVARRARAAADAVVPRSPLMDVFLWVIFPYICLAIFVVGHSWRYRYDKFGWTTRSSQLYEDRLLRWGSPLFHFGILAVFLGHVMGLGVPKSWTEAVGISEGLYHFLAVSIGAVAGIGTVVGMAILIYRRRTVGPVFSATTVMDKVMYLFLAAVIALGLWNTVASNVLGHFDYRESVSVWFRGIFYFQPDADLMAGAPAGFKAHALVAFALFALWPFTRLVHVFSAPLGYLTRPYIVYRSRDDKQLGSHSPRPGWDRVK
jgi:nitrate reductase gamma subunit